MGTRHHIDGTRTSSATTGKGTHRGLVRLDAVSVVVDALGVLDDGLDVISANEDSEAGLVGDPIGATARQRRFRIRARRHAGSGGANE